MELPKYTVTLVNYFEDDEIDLVRSTITVVEIPRDTVLETEEIWHKPKLIPDTPETLKELERLINKTLEVGNRYSKENPSQVKVVIHRESSRLVKEEGEWVTIVTGTQDLLKSPIGTIKNMSRKMGRNHQCLCGSSKKFKKCCWGKPAGKLQIQYG